MRIPFVVPRINVEARNALLLTFRGPNHARCACHVGINVELSSSKITKREYIRMEALTEELTQLLERVGKHFERDVTDEDDDKDGPSYKWFRLKIRWRTRHRSCPYLLYSMRKHLLITSFPLLWVI